MKSKTGKPRYIRHFVRAFGWCLLAGVLIGVTATGGIYLYKLDFAVRAMNAVHSGLREAFELCDLKTLSDRQISEKLASYARIDAEGGGGIDVAVRLTRGDTDSIYDSAPMFCAVCGGQTYYSDSEALWECYAHSKTTEGEKNRSQSRRLHVKDIYIRDGSDVFLPGEVEITRITLTTQKTETLEHFDLTPGNTTGYTHHNYLQNFGLIGSKRDSDALAYLRSEKYQGTFYDRIQMPGKPFAVQIDDVEMGQKFTPFRLDSAVVYHFWQDENYLLRLIYVVLAVMTVITAAVIAIFTTMHSRKIWEMEQYRRDLTNTLAHDLRTPLTAIVGYMENLRNAVNPEKQDDYMDAIQKNTEYMDKIISDVLELSVLERTQKTQTKPVDLMQLFREAFAQYEPQLESRRITLRMKGECRIQADPRMMAQTAANLVSNAVRYTPQGGEITVSGSPERLQITNTCHETLDAAKLAEPFAKSDSARSGNSGSGLGLTIVRQIMELHGFKLLLHQRADLFSVEIRFHGK